jgi:signal transduction histidine kinase
VKRLAAAAVVGVGAIELGIAAYGVQVDAHSPRDRALAVVAVAWTFVAAGAITWWRRPGNNVGPLLLAAGFAMLARQFRFSGDAVLFTIFFALGDLVFVLVGHTSLAYPTGHLTERAERALARVGYATAVAFPLAALAFYEGRSPLLFFGTPSPKSLLLVFASDRTAVLLQKTEIVVLDGVIAAIFIALIIRRLVMATPRSRRVLAPLLLAAIALAAHAVFATVYTFVSRPFAHSYLFWWQIAAAAALPVALLVGMLRARLARASVGDLVLELERTPPRDLRKALARTLGDPALDLVFWLPEQNAYVDAAGQERRLPAHGGAQRVTPIESEGRPFAALIHDPSLVEEPRLLQGAAAAARLALENARLHAETQLQLRRVQESRARIVRAADEERRRIERNLHDGAQQRLVAAALQLRTAQRQLIGRVDPEVDEVLTAAVEELQQGVDELRLLARGVHPAILTEDGLGAALESLTSRTPLPVSVRVGEERLPADVEAAAYFVACEALANAVRHARAAKVAITGERTNGMFTIQIEDDGVGGARAVDGSGLQGLADRLEALGGRLTVVSPPRHGTRITGEIPCGS